ncbi:hypothetical protein ACFL2X_00285 [Candidatus Latescibacterota bacterium]
MLKKLCVLTMLLVPAIVTAQNNNAVGPKSVDGFRSSATYIAQNVEEPENAAPENSAPAELPPLPAPRSLVTTEKPIENGLKAGTEIVPDKPVRIPSDVDPRNFESRDAAQPPAAPAEEGQAPAPAVGVVETPQEDLMIMEELSIYNVPTGNIRTVKFVNDEEFNLRSMVYGEELGYIHVLNADYNGNFREIWKSPNLNAPVRGVFIDDLEGDGETEIIGYTSDGNFYIYGYDSHDLKYRTQDGTYLNINCMQIANMDTSPEKELLFIAVKPGEEESADGQPTGYLIQFDPISQFEEWISQEKYSATDMIIGNVDNDPELEIIFNTGEILSSQFKDLEWQSTITFGSRLYLIDMDDDGILELITEFDQSYVRIIDVDQRQEKW